MNARYKKVVFDEWAVVSVADKKGRLLDYMARVRKAFRRIS